MSHKEGSPGREQPFALDLQAPPTARLVYFGVRPTQDPADRQWTAMQTGINVSLARLTPVEKGRP
jgi:hypothetical protein